MSITQNRVSSSVRIALLGLCVGLAASARARGEQAGTSTPPTDVSPGAILTRFFDLEGIRIEVLRLVGLGRDWYVRTPPSGRMCSGGLAACVLLGVGVLVERILRLRRRRIIPTDFTARFLDRLHEGKLDAGKALDYCEMNPSPAARVALAAVRRWGRPPMDLERAVALAYRVEAERLRRNVGTLRRIAVVAPLIGLLGTLSAIERVLANGLIPSVGQAGWGPAVSAALTFLTVGITIAALAIVAYDALCVRIERLGGTLDRLGAETIDAIAMAAPVPVTPLIAAGRPAMPHSVHQSVPRPSYVTSSTTQQPLPRDAGGGGPAHPEPEIRF